MVSRQSIFDLVGRLFFNRLQIKSLTKKVSTAGLTINSEGFAGYLIVNILLFSIVLSVILINDSFLYGSFSSVVNSVFVFPELFLWFLVFILSLIISYVVLFLLVNSYLSIKAEDRRKKVEQALPDFLLLVSSNIKAGMALDKGMWYAAKPEFDILSTEVKSVIKGSFSGVSMDNSLTLLASRFDSRLFTRTISLIQQSSATGGEISEILERTAQDVRNASIMKKEVSSSLVMYQIFLSFSAVLGAPFLFAVGSKLVQIFENQRFAATAVSAGSGIFSNLPTFSNLIISSTEFYYFTLATIFVTTLFTSLIVGVIKSGSRSQGLRYLPFIMAGAYFVFWTIDSFLSSYFLSFS